MTTFTLDSYGSVWPDKGGWSDSAETFHTQLATATAEWTAAGHLRIWLKLASTQAQLIPVATAQGFAFHHVQNGDLILLKCLTLDAFVPNQATHHVGAGGLVLNDQGELLAIAECTGRYANTWKSPAVMSRKGSMSPPALSARLRRRQG